MAGRVARIVKPVLLAALVVATLFAALVWWMNRDTGWNAGTVIVAPGSVKEERVGVVIVALTQPSNYNERFWKNISAKIFNTVIPWPINVIAMRDRGVVLVDPANPGATAAFEPGRLLDIEGSEKDADGVPWAERYREGEVEWVPPNPDIAHDIGHFLYSGRKQGLPTATAKTLAKARYLYHGRLTSGYLPHGDQTMALGRDAAALLKTNHKQVVAAEFADAFDPDQKKAAVRRVLDSGVDVLLLGSGQPIYSDFEELRGSFSQIREIVETWQAEKPGRKPVRIAVAPWMASSPDYDRFWLDHLAATTPPATGPGQRAAAVFSLHGLPVSLVGKDSWSRRWPATFERMKPQMEAVLKAKGYEKVTVAAGSEVFGDAIEDPDNKIVSVNELYKAAIARGDALAIAIPVEFLAENTDTLFAHQSAFMSGIGSAKAYDPPPADQDWAKPYVRRQVQGKTTVIYTGVPGGAAQPRASAILASAIAKAFPQ